MATQWFSTWFSKWFPEWWFPPLQVTDIPRQDINWSGVIERTESGMTTTVTVSAFVGTEAATVLTLNGSGESDEFRATVGESSDLAATEAGSNIVWIEGESELTVAERGDTFLATQSDSSLTVTQAEGDLRTADAESELTWQPLQ